MAEFRIYLINRLSDTARLDRMLFRFNHFFRGVDFKVVTAVDQEHIITPFIKDVPGMTRGVGGCLMSHFKVLRQFCKEAQNENELALVIEDDVMFHLNFRSLLQECWNALQNHPSKRNLVLLSAYRSIALPNERIADKSPSGYEFIPIPAEGGIWSTAAYLITLPYSQRIIKAYDKPVARWLDQRKCTSEIIPLRSKGTFIWPPIAIEECVETHIQPLPIAVKFQYWQQFGVENFLLNGDPVIGEWRRIYGSTFVDSIRPRNESKAPECSKTILILSDRNPYLEYDAFVEKIPQKNEPSVYSLCMWELDYLRHILAPFNIRWAWSNDVKSLNSFSPDIVAFSSNVYKCEEITKVYKPPILIVLSDEWNRTPEMHRSTVGIPLVLRQHHHSQYYHHDGVVCMALGFMQGLFGKEIAFPQEMIAPVERKYNWAFAGHQRGDRQDMIKTFETSELTGVVKSCHLLELRDLYLNSTFILCPRGNIKMDCFRNYEALLCGAIPVVAGCDEKEFKETFGFLGDVKWIYTETWEKAVEECKKLLLEPEILATMQKDNIRWWHSHIDSIRNKIRKVIQK